MMKAIALAIACVVTTFSDTALAQDYGAQLYAFSIRSGETLLFRRVTSTTSSCEPLFESVEGIDLLQGPTELSFRAEPQMVRTSVTGKDCPNPVAGAGVFVTAASVSEPKDVVITVRVRMATKNGPWQNTLRSHMLIYPAAAGADHAAQDGQLTQEAKP
jgi:hypothetical protein